MSVVPRRILVVDPGSPPWPMFTLFVFPVDVAPAPRFNVEFPVLFAATLRVNAVLELEPPTETEDAALARLSVDTLVENMVAELSVVVMSPPFTARSPEIVRELDPVAKVSPEVAANAPFALNCTCVLEPAGEPLPPVDAMVTDPSEPVVRVTLDPALR